MITRRNFVVGFLAIILAVGGFIIASNFSGATHQSARTSAIMDNEGNAITNVTLKDNKATPDTVTVLAGNTVQFNSADNKKHNMAEGEGNAAGHVHNHEGSYQSRDFGANEAWRVRFKKAGNYFFHDHYNPDLNVLVVVYEHKG